MPRLWLSLPCPLPGSCWGLQRVSLVVFFLILNPNQVVLKLPAMNLFLNHFINGNGSPKKGLGLLCHRSCTKEDKQLPPRVAQESDDQK